jgi:SSS family solute:Na+ symporter
MNPGLNKIGGLEMGSTIVILTVVALYFLILLWIGYYSRKKTTLSVEDYFMASRQFGTLTLLMSLFATNMTAFIMIGMPGVAYHAGIGAFGWGIIFCVTNPTLFFLIGYRGWLLGKKYGYMTMSEIFSDRYESEAINIITFVLLVWYTIPYLAISVIGGGLAFKSMTNGSIPYWLGGLIITLVVFCYTFLGGMRGTAWTNVFQGFFFMTAVWVAFFLIAYGMGGLENITQNLLNTKPQLLQRSGVPQFSYRMWFSFILVIINGPVVPQLWLRLLTGKSYKTMQRMGLCYPIAGVLTWLPCILIGVWGAIAFPGLIGKASDNILPMMVAKFTHPIVTAFLLAGIFAAIMSSLDAMILTVSTMFTRDILSRYAPKAIEGREVLTGRIFIIGVTIATYILALIRPSSILGIMAYAFSGLSLLLPVAFAAFYWRRSTKQGIIAAMILSTALLLMLQFKILPASLNFGFMPVVPAMVVAILALIVISYLTRPPSHETIEKYHGFLDANLRY